jgi:hypothetical protein
MRPRTKLPIPEPTGSEFKNFDRLMGILLSKKVAKPKGQTQKERPAPIQDNRVLPRPWRLRPNAGCAGELLPYAPSSNSRENEREPLTVGHVFSVVVTKDLLIDIPEQMKRFNTDIRDVQSTLQQAPEILHRVGLYVAVYVLNSIDLLRRAGIRIPTRHRISVHRW